MTAIELVQLSHQCVNVGSIYNECVPHIRLHCSRFVEARSEFDDAIEDIQ